MKDMKIKYLVTLVLFTLLNLMVFGILITGLFSEVPKDLYNLRDIIILIDVIATILVCVIGLARNSDKTINEIIGNKKKKLLNTGNSVRPNKVDLGILQTLMDDIMNWSDGTFPGGSNRGPQVMLYHLRKEVEELILAIESNTIESNESQQEINMEFADCFMLLLDSATHAKLTANDVVRITKAKLEVNKHRKWGIPDEHGVVEHLRENPKWCDAEFLCEEPVCMKGMGCNRDLRI